MKRLSVLIEKYFLCRASKKALKYCFCVLLCYDGINIIKEGIPSYFWMYFTLIWLYSEHQMRCCNIYFNVFYSALILCIASKKVLHHLFECFILYRDYMQIIKEGVPRSIWTHHPLLWFFVEHLWCYCTVYLNAFTLLWVYA